MENNKIVNRQHLTDKLTIKYKWIHYSKKTRLKWRWVNITIYFVIFLLFVGVAICWTTGGLKFDENLPEQYVWPTSKVLLLVGMILFLVNIILFTLFGYCLATIFNKSRLLYFQSSEYSTKRIKYMEDDLTKYSKKDVKWLYKLHYIDKVKYDLTLKKINNKK